MATLHVIGVYLQVRFGVHSRLRRHTDVSVGLVSLCLDGSLRHLHFAGEGSYRFVVQDIFVELAALAVREVVVDLRRVVDVLFRIADRHTAESGLAVFSVDIDLDIVAGKTVVERNVVDQ